MIDFIKQFSQHISDISNLRRSAADLKSGTRHGPRDRFGARETLATEPRGGGQLVTVQDERVLSAAVEVAGITVPTGELWQIIDLQLDSTGSNRMLLNTTRPEWKATQKMVIAVGQQRTATTPLTLIGVDAVNFQAADEDRMEAWSRKEYWAFEGENLSIELGSAGSVTVTFWIRYWRMKAPRPVLDLTGKGPWQ